MNERTLYAFLGGVAASGAKYKIEVLKVASGYQADAYSAGGATGWTKPTLVERSGLLPVVLRKALTKFAEKIRPGRDRTYDTPMYGGSPVGAIPKELDGSDLPDHPLCWQVGRDLALLPQELHSRAMLAAGQDLQAKGWHLHRTCTSCISAARHDVRLALPVYASFQLEACIRQAYGYQAAWEWLHEGGAGYSWGWRLVTSFHITYAAVHPTLGRIPRSRYDSIWLDALPERIIEDLVVEALQVQHHRCRSAVVFARYVARRMLADRAAHNAAVFAAIPAAAFEQQELV